MKRLAFTLFAVFAAVTLCSAQNPNGTRVVKDASGRVKYTVQKTEDREIIKDSKGKVVGSTRQTKDRKYHYNSNGTSARLRNQMVTDMQTAGKPSYGKS